ncbi:MAG: universal stress protein [Methanobacteriaceae archaeon]|nr:universal stress protein [Methanobacteriaceae archaeon]
MYKKILVATDGSKHSKKAGEHAIEISNLTGGDILVLNVIETSYLQTLPGDDLIEKLEEAMKKEGQKAVDDFTKQLEINKCDGACTTINLKTALKLGNPADVILKTIEKENIDLVVMGNSGKHGLDRFLLGSVAEKVLRSAPCPVLVVK